MDLGSELITRLNGSVEAATKVARSQGVPVLFVPTVEDAFLPEHTICDGDGAYVRSPETIALAPGGPDLASYLTAHRVNPFNPSATDVAIDDLERRVQELFHPNVNGYTAIGQAVLRWSQTEAANAPLPNSRRKRDTLRVDGTPEPLGQLDGTAPAETLQGGRTYRLQVDGFASGSPIEVSVQSRLRVLAVTSAGERGEVDDSVTIPSDLDAGEHTLTIMGLGDDGHGVAVNIPFRIDDRPRIPWTAVGAGLMVLLLLAGLVLRRRGRGTAD